MANPISHLLIPLDAATDSDAEADEEAAAMAGTISAASFWPPFPAFLSDSDADDSNSEFLTRTPVFAPPMDDDEFQETASGFLGLAVGALGLGLELDLDDDDDGADWGAPEEGGDGGGFFLSRRGAALDSDSDEQIVAVAGEEDLGLPLCWDCLQLEDQRRDFADDLEWEQVAADGAAVADEEAEAEAEAEALRSLEWEVLLAVNSLGHSPDADGIETYLVDAGGDMFDDPDASDVLFGQFVAAADHDSPAKGGLPAARSVVETLPTVAVSEADAARGDMQCAVCKDAIAAGEQARKLPCAHLYHDDCILPWLAMRNTCPLCRHELPTDDPEYEKWKARRAEAGNAAPGGARHLRYEFEMPPED